MNFIRIDKISNFSVESLSTIISGLNFCEIKFYDKQDSHNLYSTFSEFLDIKMKGLMKSSRTDNQLGSELKTSQIALILKSLESIEHKSEYGLNIISPDTKTQLIDSILLLSKEDGIKKLSFKFSDI